MWVSLGKNIHGLFRPILKRKSFVAIRLWRNMNWNTRNFVSVVHRNKVKGIFNCCELRVTRPDMSSGKWL